MSRCLWGCGGVSPLATAPLLPTLRSGTRGTRGRGQIASARRFWGGATLADPPMPLGRRAGKGEKRRSLPQTPSTPEIIISQDNSHTPP